MARGDYGPLKLFDPWEPPVLRQASLPADRADRALRYAGRHKYLELMHLVPPTLERPEYVFRGLKREEMEASLCYAARHPRRYMNDETVRAVEAGFIFAVYLDEDDKVYEWRWTKESNIVPENFEEQLWPRR